MGPSPLEHLFNPKSIAVLGTSDSGLNLGSHRYGHVSFLENTRTKAKVTGHLVERICAVIYPPFYY